jgi:thioredoxin reductase
MNRYHIGIIGAGPAGMACALQLRRVGLEPVVFEREEPQSMLRMANWVENYLGFPEGIRGEDLYRHFREQLDRFQVEHIYKEVRNIVLYEEDFLIDTYDENYLCSVLVLASGTRPKTTIVPYWKEGVEKYLHYDISGIPMQDGLDLGIIGIGDAAFDYALNLHKRGHQVKIFGRSQTIMANQALMDRFRRIDGIELNLNHVLISVDEIVEGKVRCRFKKNDTHVEHNLDCLIFATGRDANLDFLDEGILDRMEELKEKKKLYMAGDVRNGDFRQTAIATGDGIKVAMQIFQHEGNPENRR